jgi:exonuclease SbcC
MLTLNSELSLSVQLLESLQQHVPGWQESYINAIGKTGAAFAVLFLFFWLRFSSHNKRITAMQAESAKLAGIMNQVRSVPEYELTPVSSQTEDDEDEEQQQIAPQITAVACYDNEKYTALLPKVESVTALASVVTDYAETEQLWLAEQISLRNMTISVLVDEINVETDRVNQAEDLHSEIASLQSTSDELSAQLDQWDKAIELLAGASKHFSSKFNRDIRDLMARNLPVFTQGRYEHLQVQPGLGVRVFSNDKHDFLDMDEISSGTQRQIMLALRLAMAQKLMGQTVKGRQFTFLDEPFAFFDEERTRHALQALDELSDAISQIWIVSQTFPDGHKFATEINCSREQRKLSLAV